MFLALLYIDMHLMFYVFLPSSTVPRFTNKRIIVFFVHATVNTQKIKVNILKFTVLLLCRVTSGNCFLFSPFFSDVNKISIL